MQWHTGRHRELFSHLLPGGRPMDFRTAWSRNMVSGHLGLRFIRGLCWIWFNSWKELAANLTPNLQELFHKSKNDSLASLAEENSRLLKSQSFMEEKLGKSFVGLSLHQTLEDLIQVGHDHSWKFFPRLLQALSHQLSFGWVFQSLHFRADWHPLNGASQQSGPYCWSLLTAAYYARSLY